MSLFLSRLFGSLRCVPSSHSPLVRSASAVAVARDRRLFGVPSTFSRTMFIQTESTPNPDSLKFMPGVAVMSSNATRNFASPLESFSSPLARKLFGIDGVLSVFFGSDFITVTKKPATNWSLLKPGIFATVMDHFTGNQPLFVDDASQPQDTAPQAGDSETVLAIKELLETKIRPVIQEDGGDLEYRGFESGIVKVKLVGACSTCPSSTATLKGGIENMLMHYIPEVVGVESVTDKTDKESIEEFNKFEKELENKQNNN